MALYFLTYDLRGNQDYEKLYEELDNFKAVRVLESTWCFNRIKTTCIGLRIHFMQFINANDGLLIEESNNWTAFNTDGSPDDLK